MAEQVGDTFLTNIVNLLKEGDTSQILSIFSDDNNCDIIYNSSWDLIPIVCGYLSEESHLNNSNVFKCCLTLINTLAKHSNAEETLLQFIEEIELAAEDRKFLSLLKPLETVLIRVPEKRVTSLGWCFNAIKQYLHKIETSDKCDLVDEERLLLDNEESVIRVTTVYNSLLLLCDLLITEFRNGVKGKNFEEKKQVLGKFLIDLLGKPLAFLNMEVHRNTKSKTRLISENLVASFCSLSLDPFSLFEVWHEADLIKPDDLSFGVFYYLVLAKGVCLEQIPKVYNPVYILHHCLCLVNVLLSQTSTFVIEKALSLTSTLLQSTSQKQLSYLLLDCECHSKFCKLISNVILHNNNEALRKKGLDIFRTYLWSFEDQGRYLLIINLMRYLSHSGLKGFVITQYKEMVREESSRKTWSTLNKYYKEHKLFDLLDEFTLLKNNEETDLVDESDQIVSTINLLRFLVMADKSGDTGIDCYVDTLDQVYFEHLKKGIALSKEHYRLKMKEVTEEQESKKKEKAKVDVSVTVSGKNLLEMPAENKIEVMNMSLTTLDVLDSLLSRLMECIHLKHANV